MIHLEGKSHSSRLFKNPSLGKKFVILNKVQSVKDRVSEHTCPLAEDNLSPRKLPYLPSMRTYLFRSVLVSTEKGALDREVNGEGMERIPFIRILLFRPCEYMRRY